MNLDLLTTENREISVSGTGDTFADAVQKCFSEVRRRVYREVGHPIVYLEPVSFKVTDYEKKVYTERFLEVLFPRKREKYRVQVTVGVLVKYVSPPENTGGIS